MNFNYQNIEVTNLSDSILTNKPNSFDNYNYQNVISPYQYNADPRLNYANYNTVPISPYNYASPEYTFPIPLMYDLSLPKESPSVPIKTDEELWIETWLSKIGKIQINLNSTVEIATLKNTKTTKKTIPNIVQIHTAKNLLKNCINVLDKLQSTHEFLKVNADNMSSADWKKKTLEIGSMKEEFSKMMSNFENPETLKILQKTVENRTKKRRCQKRKRKTIALNRNLEKEEQKIKEKKIDEWLENMAEQVERAKINETMKKDADCVLAEVTRKKAEAKKSLTLISSLIKLRDVREHSALQQGEKVSLEDHNAFEKVSKHLIKIWMDALQIYGKEEKTLRLMLEETVTRDNTVFMAKERRITQQWQNFLFGPKCLPTAASYGLTVADQDFETFIAIRKSWDTFLSKPEDVNGSKIPVGWVTPTSTPVESWAKFMNTQ